MRVSRGEGGRVDGYAWWVDVSHARRAVASLRGGGVVCSHLSSFAALSRCTCAGDRAVKAAPFLLPPVGRSSGTLACSAFGLGLDCPPAHVVGEHPPQGRGRTEVQP